MSSRTLRATIALIAISLPAATEISPPFCFGDGGISSGCTDCPCGNNAPAGTGGGCLNGAGSGARILASGSPSVAGDTLRFETSGCLPHTFAIFTSADDQLPSGGGCPAGAGGAGAFDGLRCIGDEFLRHGARAVDANGNVGLTNAGWGPPDAPFEGIIQYGASSMYEDNFEEGGTRYFQILYRSDVSMMCGTGINSTDAVGVTFEL